MKLVHIMKNILYRFIFFLLDAIVPMVLEDGRQCEEFKLFHQKCHIDSYVKVFYLDYGFADEDVMEDQIYVLPEKWTKYPPFHN